MYCTFWKYCVDKTWFVMSLSWYAFRFIEIYWKFFNIISHYNFLNFNFGFQQLTMETAYVVSLYFSDSCEGNNVLTLLILHFVDVNGVYIMLHCHGICLLVLDWQEEYLQVTVWCMLRLSQENSFVFFFIRERERLNSVIERIVVSLGCVLIFLVSERLRDHQWFEMRGG